LLVAYDARVSIRSSTFVGNAAISGGAVAAGLGAKVEVVADCPPGPGERRPPTPGLHPGTGSAARGASTATRISTTSTVPWLCHPSMHPNITVAGNGLRCMRLA
jgi:hypothetical protein